MTPSALPSRPTRPVRTPPASHAWTTAAHWLPLVTSWIGPLVLLLTRGERDAAVREEAKEALNVEITWSIVIFAAALLVSGLPGLALVVVLLFVRLVAYLAATARASDGWAVRYPLTLRIVR